MKTVRSTLFALIAWWLWMPAVIAAYQVMLDLLMPGMGTWHRALAMWLDRWVWSGSPWGWAWVTIGAIGSLVIVGGFWAESYERNRGQSAGMTALVLTSVALLGLGFAQTWRGIWDDDKDLARFYSTSTRFLVPNADDPPSSIQKLFDRNPRGDGHRCLLRGPRGDDVPACVARGTLPVAGFEPRAASRDGAMFTMQRTSGNKAGVNLKLNTLTYLAPRGGEQPRWSAIRDGSGLSQPMDGVVEWIGGSANPTECLFRGDHRIDRALAGARKNSLPNLLNDRYPDLEFLNADDWGYCDHGRPVIVFPVRRQVHTHQRTAMTAAGVVLMTGTRSGEPHLVYRSRVRAGELPGPSYPVSLVDRQRAATEWAAGRRVKDNMKFGYELTSSKVQEGNNGSYLLRSATDHRLYWVSPLRPRSSDSELFVAYSVIRADQVAAGHLNEQDVYVLADNDERVVNLDQLAAAAKDFVSQVQPGFISAGGKLVEFLPTNSDIWQAYGELNGRVVYRLRISATDKIQPELVSIGPGTPAEGGTPPVTTTGGGQGCDAPAATMPQAELVACLQRLADELGRRSGAQPPAG
jgi:hypothetical protein